MKTFDQLNTYEQVELLRRIMFDVVYELGILAASMGINLPSDLDDALKQLLTRKELDEAA